MTLNLGMKFFEARRNDLDVLTIAKPVVVKNHDVTNNIRDTYEPRS